MTWQKGQSGNPNGRPKGARNRLSESVLSELITHWEEHGFLVMTKGHLWQERLAREWRLTIEECDGRQATDDWIRWSEDNPVSVVPKNSRSQSREQNDTEVGTNRYQSKTQRLHSKEFEDLVTIE